MDTANVQIVYVKEVPEYIKRAQARYRAQHREEAKAYTRQYIAKMKENDVEQWRAKKREYQNRYNEKQRQKHQLLQQQIVPI